MAFNRAYKMTAVILAALILLVINSCGSGQLDDNQYVTVLVTESGGSIIQVTKTIDPDPLIPDTYTIPDDPYPLTISNVPLGGSADDPLSLKITRVYLEVYETTGNNLIDTKDWYPDFLIEGNSSGSPSLPSLVDWDIIDETERLGNIADFTCYLTIYSTEIDNFGNSGADHVDESIGSIAVLITSGS